MNIALHINQISSQNLFLLDTKNNVIMENGKFTKLNYGTDYFTMNGLYLIFKMQHFFIENNNNKKNLKFDPNHANNISFVQELTKLELKILDFYSANKCKSFKQNLLLKKQLSTGFMKVYKERLTTNFNASCYVLKISGIWESSNEIGITYKLFETNSLIH